MQIDLPTYPLESNGYELDSTPERLGRLTPTDPRLPMQALREQYAAQGYLWLKGVLDRDSILDFRRRVFEAFRPSGIVAPDTDAVDGIYAGEAGEKQGTVHPNRITSEIVRWARYEAFCLAEPIIEFYETFLDGAVYLHKRKLLRYTRPDDPKCTPAHYDLVYLRGGTEHVCTSWIPIGDTPAEMGGLIYLENSHLWGREMEAEYARQNAHLPPEERVKAYTQDTVDRDIVGRDLNALANRVNARWLMADYEAGDMVVHGSYTIHASTVNRDPNGHMRLSTDIRYQRVRDEIDVRWANHWSLDDML
jgi:ectoine hydroxylase-related dioxygenase (phytanoyl-CoA dioxygenase family)